MASAVPPSGTQDSNGLENPPPTSSPHSLSKATHARRAEYTRVQKIKVKIGSWNVAACPGTERDLGAWFVEEEGIDQNLSGLGVSNTIETDQRPASIKGAGSQQAQRINQESTIPRGNQGTVGGEDIGLYALGLQEIVELTSAKEYIGRVYSDPGPTAKWRKALSDALPAGYELVAEQQLSGLLILIFASPTVAPTISSVSTVSVGTGIMGYLGNKGAVSTRIVLGETTRLVFVNSHLASGADLAHLDRRCWDVSQILARTHFDPISWAGVLDEGQEGIGEGDFAFWFGDLNFRLDGLPGEDIRRLLILHTKGEYGTSQQSRNKIEGQLGVDDDLIIVRHSGSDDDSEEEGQPRPSSTISSGDSSSYSLPDPDEFMQDPHSDPMSLQATLDSLMPHDELRHVQKARKAFHDGWREGPITFLPTYKYDVGSMFGFDSSETKRAPSWCDRILYRTRRDKLEFDKKIEEEELARIRDEEMKARGIDEAGDDEAVLFDYDPESDGVEQSTTHDGYEEYDDENDDQMQPVVTQEGFVDRISLDVYTSHQRVTSSDHKPLHAVFTLEYDAVVPELKSKIQQEVARELDRAENEGRPGITIVVDDSHEIEEVAQADGPTSPSPSIESAEGVNFGRVAFQQRKYRALTIANTSQVAATFAFVDRPSITGKGDQITPEWVRVSFINSDLNEDERLQNNLKSEVTLEPGEAINVTLEVFIHDISLVRSLNREESKLDDILVLRVTDGRDHFIPIKGTWLQSCFGRSVAELIKVPEGGVRALLPRPRGASGGPINRGQEVYWSAPRELFKLTEAVESLTERVIADENMIENSRLPRDSPGWPFDEKSWVFIEEAKSREFRRSCVLEALDSDKNLNSSFPLEIGAVEKLEIMAEVLVTFLASLSDGIVTEDLWVKLEQDMIERGPKQILDVEEKKAWVLDTLSASPNHNISFVFLTSMLSRVAAELAPVQNAVSTSSSGSARSSMDIRRSLSFRGKPPPAPSDPALLRRQAVDRQYVDVFAPVIFRAPVRTKDKERKAMEERRRDILEAFLS